MADTVTPAKRKDSKHDGKGGKRPGTYHKQRAIRKNQNRTKRAIRSINESKVCKIFFQK